mmetsp:Transcript_23112/g.68186  ORF Transcript_23112/g.68186 Transcript_23112/m.68186 type:complete len:211 (+) Transcript_23112:584-1216(+)
MASNLNTYSGSKHSPPAASIALIRSLYAACIATSSASMPPVPSPPPIPLLTTPAALAAATSATARASGSDTRPCDAALRRPPTRTCAKGSSSAAAAGGGSKDKREAISAPLLCAWCRSVWLAALLTPCIARSISLPCRRARSATSLCARWPPSSLGSGGAGSPVNARLTALGGGSGGGSCRFASWLRRTPPRSYPSVLECHVLSTSCVDR